MKRCRKVMDAAKDGCLIDIHSGNNFAPQYGMVSPALQYMMLMPCARRSSLAGSLLFCKPNKLCCADMDSTMFGEGYQQGYDRPADTMQQIDGGGPDWWLIEVSAIPFGLMNDMLGMGQRWRGWLFGCVTRLPYPGGQTNGADWALWDRFKLTEATMIGWWEKQSVPPVRVVAPAGADAATTAACTTTPSRTGHVLATAYVLKGEHTLVSVASWANATVSCDLLVDWAALGLQAPTQVEAQDIDGFQTAATFAADADRIKNVTVATAAGRCTIGCGWLIVLGKAPPAPPPPPAPPNPIPAHYKWQNISLGGQGSGSTCSCAFPPCHANSCIFNSTYCDESRYGGQCAMKETDAEAKCGAWEHCDGVVCKAGYGGCEYSNGLPSHLATRSPDADRCWSTDCLARSKMTSDADPDMWGYKKVASLTR